LYSDTSVVLPLLIGSGKAKNCKNLQGSDTRVIPPKNLVPFFGQKTHFKNPAKHPAPSLIQVQFVTPVLVKGFFMFTASDDQ